MIKFNEIVAINLKILAIIKLNFVTKKETEMEELILLQFQWQKITVLNTVLVFTSSVTTRSYHTLYR